MHGFITITRTTFMYEIVYHIVLSQYRMTFINFHVKIYDQLYWEIFSATQLYTAHNGPKVSP